MADPQVLFLGEDLYARGQVITYPAINEMKSFKNDKLITNAYDIQVRNEDNFFSLDNPVSPYNGINIYFQPIRVIGTKGEDIWNGIVTTILREHTSKTAIIRSKNSMFKFYERIIVYTSSDWETGADAFKNISDAIGFTDYDTAAVQTSINQLTDANCLLKVDLQQEDGATFQSIIEKLGEYSNADVYSHNNIVFFVHWVRTTADNSSISITEKDFKAVPSVSEAIEEIVNDYSIGYDADNETPATDSNSNNIGSVSRTKYGTRSLPEMQSSEGTQIIFKDKVSAIYIGEGYVRRTQKGIDTAPQNPKPLVRTTFEIFSDFRSFINLQTRYRKTFSDESWTNKLFEIFEFTINEDEDKIAITSFEVEV